jgi:hypothetical protein
MSYLENFKNSQVDYRGVTRLQKWLMREGGEMD